MGPTPRDVPWREFNDAVSFLTVAKALIEVGAWVWRPLHQTAHDINEMEAVQFLRFATARMCSRDPNWEGRWRVAGTSFTGRRILVSASIWMSPAGDVVYIATAFEEGKWTG